jgi:hypothetical protein
MEPIIYPLIIDKEPSFGNVDACSGCGFGYILSNEVRKCHRCNAILLTQSQFNEIQTKRLCSSYIIKN